MPFYAPIGKEQRLQQAALPFLTCEEKTENHSGPGEFRLPEGECMRDNNDCLIRLARPDDAAALLEIYAPYVRDTAITFEYPRKSFRGAFCPLRRGIPISSPNSTGA